MKAVSQSPPDVRARVLAAGARLLAEQGPEALTARRLAGEVGTSTMAVYTHFGGMGDVRRAIREDGYARLAHAWGNVERTRDPVADLTVSGASYVAFALTNPNLYRAMFFDVPAQEARAPEDVAATAVGFVRRCVEAGRFRGDPWSVMWQLWSATHGSVGAILAGMLTMDELDERLRALGMTMYVGFGDDRAAAARSLERGWRRIRDDARRAGRVERRP